MKLTHLAVLGAGAVAVAQPHIHGHLHRKHASPVEKRADITEVVQGPTTTVYVMDGTEVPATQATQGIQNGLYVVLDDTAADPAQASAAEFFTVASSSEAAAPIPTSSPEPGTPIPAVSMSSEAAAPTTSSAAPLSGSSGNSGGGLNSPFPSGQIDCSDFPSSYGPIPVDYLGMGGWIGTQQGGGYQPGDSSISNIRAGVAGEGCATGMFCSYACPPGFLKSQWPTAQGSAGQSVGGLWCNANNKLELTNPTYNVLCIPGAQNVQAVNNAWGEVNVCATDYPGSEGETVPEHIPTGSSVVLTCQDQSTYYQWQGKKTSTQLYINSIGVSQQDACQWGAPGSNMGNWAPVNAGCGRDELGNIYLSIFPNTPTNPSVDFNGRIEITGDVTVKCELINNVFYQDGTVMPNGCTVSFFRHSQFTFQQL